MRETLLRGLASRAAKDPEFLRRVRKDPKGTLIEYGYHLTTEEMRLVESLQQQSAGMSDEELARMLASGSKSYQAYLRTRAPRLRLRSR